MANDFFESLKTGLNEAIELEKESKKTKNIEKSIVYCTNKNCKRQCKRNMSKYNIAHTVVTLSNFDAEKDFDENNCKYFLAEEDNITSYAIWNDFEFRPPTYLDKHFEPNVYALVKWQEHEPYEVIDLDTGNKRMSTRNCFVIGSLIWDKKEPGFDFESCGLRYLEERVDGLEEFILNFAKQEYEKRISKEGD